MDIKEKINEIVAKLKGDKNLLESFKTDPVKTVEKLLGIDLPDDKINKIVEGIKAKIDLETVKDKLDADKDGKVDLDDAKKAIGGLFDKFKK